MKEKLFICYWPMNSYDITEGEAVKLCTIDFFNEENGYYQDDIEAIKNLDLREHYLLNDGHTVICVDEKIDPYNL